MLPYGDQLLHPVTTDQARYLTIEDLVTEAASLDVREQ